jgi:asparagine synthase (glutamine-hydrolysing)
MHQLVLLNNGGFQWQKAGRIHVKGYLLDSINNISLGPAEVANLFREVDSLVEFAETLEGLTGCFAIILETEDGFLACSDIVRSIPLFYVLRNDLLILTDSANYLYNTLGERTLEQGSMDQFRSTGYVLGRNTLLCNVKQIEAGQIIHFNGRLNRSFYLKPAASLDVYEKITYDDIDKISEKVFGGLVKSVAGKRVLIPLSGGYDSRYIAIMLHKLGLKDCTCYTYGRRDNPEIRESKHAADTLGFDWFFIEYTENDWKEIMDTGLLTKYMEFAGNFVSLPHIQDFLAVYKLLQTGKIDSEMVVIPGHSGDMITGNHIPAELVKRNKPFFTQKDVPYFISRYHYRYKKCDVTDEWKEFAAVNGLNISKGGKISKTELISFLDRWNIAERQAKYIANAVRVYEFFSMEWRMPLWHHDFVDFWERVPLKSREYKKLYNDFLDKRLFPEFGLELHKSSSQASDYLSRMPFWADKMIRRFRDRLIRKEPKDFLYILPALNIKGDRGVVSSIIDYYLETMGLS